VVVMAWVRCMGQCGNEWVVGHTEEWVHIHGCLHDKIPLRDLIMPHEHARACIVNGMGNPQVKLCIPIPIPVKPIPVAYGYVRV
jgi:hypothetical protein